MLQNYYSIKNRVELSAFFDAYIRLVLNQFKIFNINFTEFGISGDHLGLQVLSSDEFDLVNDYTLGYSTLIHTGEIHNRRNNVYKLNESIVSNGVAIESLEIFEPKANADLSKLKPGFEHIAFKVDRYDDLLLYLHKHNLPIDKERTFKDGSKFFKTKLLNLAEIEFRDDYLWKLFVKE